MAQDNYTNSPERRAWLESQNQRGPAAIAAQTSALSRMAQAPMQPQARPGPSMIQSTPTPRPLTATAPAGAVGVASQMPQQPAPLASRAGSPAAAGPSLMDSLRKIGTGSATYQNAQSTIGEGAALAGDGRYAAAAGRLVRGALANLVANVKDAAQVAGESWRTMTSPLRSVGREFGSGFTGGSPAPSATTRLASPMPVSDGLESAEVGAVPPQPIGAAPQTSEGDAQSSYDTFRGNMRNAMNAQMRLADTSNGTRPAPGLVERGNAGLRALASSPELREAMNAQYRTDNIGVQASVDPNGRMRFSDAPTDPSRPATQRAISSGGNLSEDSINATTDRMRQLGMQSSALRDQVGFNAGGGLTRRLSPEEIAQNMLASPSRSDRQAALGYRAGQQRTAAEERLAQSAERQNQPQFMQQVIAAQQAQRVSQLQDEYRSTQDPARRKQIADEIRMMTGRENPKFQITTAEEALDPNNPMFGTRKTPYLIDEAGNVRPIGGEGGGEVAGDTPPGMRPIGKSTDGQVVFEDSEGRRFVTG